MSDQTGSPFPFPDAPGPDLYDVCVHCGFCLPACPTYQETGLEEHSPRGRVFLIRAAGEGRIALTDPALRHPVDTCLDCRACEVVCPAGVRIGTLVERTRGQFHEGDRKRGRRPPLAVRALARTLSLRHGPQAVATLGRLYQKGRAAHRGRDLARSPSPAGRRWADRLPAPLGDLEAAMPRVSGRLTRLSAPERTPAQGALRSRVAFFTGCVGDALFTSVNEATLRVLARNGYEVVVEREQVCCGGLARDLGDRDRARALARRNIDRLGGLEVDAIVTNQGGCGAMLTEYPDLFRDDPAWEQRARALTDRVVDVTRLLVEKGFDPPSDGPAVCVTYHGSCHLTNVMHTVTEPIEILRSIPNLKLLEMANPSRCCGSAGVYNLTEPEMAYRLLDGKMASVPPGAEIVATGNPGCALWLGVGARRVGHSLEILHPVELLDRAYRMSEGAGPTVGDPA